MDTNKRVFSMFLAVILLLTIVASKSSDPYAVTQIGVYIDGKYIAAKPESKSFTSSPGITAFSLLPLDRYHVYLDLQDISPEALKSVEVSALIGTINDAAYKDIAAEAVVLWDFLFDETGRRIEDSFRPIGGGPVNLNPTRYQSYSYYQVQLIAGTKNQIDAGNKRYIVQVHKTPDIGRLDLYMYTHNGHGNRAYIDRDYSSSTKDGVTNYQISILRNYGSSPRVVYNY